MIATVVHELPGRLRLSLKRRPSAPVDQGRVETQFKRIPGVEQVRYTPGTGSLLVRYSGGNQTREQLLRLSNSLILPTIRKPQPSDELTEKRGGLIRSSILFALSPLIPLPVRTALSIYGAVPVLLKGFGSLRQRKMDVALLDASAVGASLATGEFSTASVITFLLNLGEYLDEWARGKSRQLLAAMFQTGDDTVWVERNGQESEILLIDLIPGDTVIVRMGSLIPVDGSVLSGEAMVNQSSLTGEPLAVARRCNASVYAGTVVEEGELWIRAVKTGDATKVARMVQIIEQGELLKADYQSMSERTADRIVPYSFLLSALTLAATGNPARAAAVLLVDYSCAIKLSTPLTILASLATAAKQGILIKGGKYIEQLSRIDTVVLDKTGTLTEATPRVAEVVAYNGHTREFILQLGACVEEHFPHPVATAVVKHAADNNITHDEEHAAVVYLLAHGIVTQLDGKRVIVGSRHFVEDDEQVDLSLAASDIQRFGKQGASLLFIAIDGKLSGMVALHDPLRSDAPAFVQQLKQHGLNPIMLTGDTPATAALIAKQVGIDTWYAQALPEDKVRLVQQLQQQGHCVAMVGDGINDSPALSYADLGVSLKHGSDIARETADLLLMRGRLDDLLIARSISKEAMDLLKTNFRLIMSINSVALAMAVTGFAPPLLSAALHNAGTVGVALHSLKPLKRKEEPCP
jgi:manganese/zinc-transporting P-type ATPase C